MEILCIGVSVIIIIVAVLMFVGYSGVVVKSICYPARITGISEEGVHYAVGGVSYSFQVEFKYKRKVVRKPAMNAVFLMPFFEKWKLERCRKRYTGMEVHVYYNPDNPAQIIIKEQLWKIFLTPAVLLILGVFALVMGLM